MPTEAPAVAMALITVTLPRPRGDGYFLLNRGLAPLQEWTHERARCRRTGTPEDHVGGLADRGLRGGRPQESPATRLRSLLGGGQSALALTGLLLSPRACRSRRGDGRGLWRCARSA
jgi:hypothetical protein